MQICQYLLVALEDTEAAVQPNHKVENEYSIPIPINIYYNY